VPKQKQGKGRKRQSRTSSWPSSRLLKCVRNRENEFVRKGGSTAIRFPAWTSDGGESEGGGSSLEQNHGFFGEGTTARRKILQSRM
jgi:hypothetical protein